MHLVLKSACAIFPRKIGVRGSDILKGFKNVTLSTSVLSDQNSRKPILKIDRNRRGNGLVIINIDFDQLHTAHLATYLDY